MKPFLDFYIKDISISPGLIKPSNKTDFKPDDWLRLSLCLLGGKKKKQEKIKTLRIPTSVHCLGKGLKGSKSFVCGLKVAKMPSSTSIRPLANHKEPKQFILLTSTKLWSVRNSQTEWDLPWAGRSVNLSSLCFRESGGSPAGSADPGLSPQVLLSRFQKHPGQVGDIRQRVFPLALWPHLHCCHIQTDSRRSQAIKFYFTAIYWVPAMCWTLWHSHI